MCPCVCLSVCLQNIPKILNPSNSFFGGLLSDPGRKLFHFEKKNRPGVRGGGKQNLALMIRDRVANFRVAISPTTERVTHVITIRH